MNPPLLLQVFEGAAPPQKLLFLAFAATTLVALASLAARLGRRRELSPALLDRLVVLCPMLGVLCAAFNGVHMMRTVVRLPITVTAQMLAPGLMEIAALVLAGTIAGLAAALARDRGAPRLRRSEPS